MACAIGTLAVRSAGEVATDRSPTMRDAADEGIERVVWPRAMRRAEPRPLAKRLDTLEGKTIAQLWDDLFRGDEIFPMLEEALLRRYPGVRFVGYRAFGSTHGGDEQKVIAEMPERLRELGVDAVISGMAC
jgi:hypothetical protein